LTIW